MKHQGVLLLTLMIFAIQSCKKEDCGEKEPKQVQRLASIKNYHLDGTYYTVKYEYNSAGQLNKEKQLDENDTLLFETVFHYQNGRLAVEEIGTSPRISEFRYTYTGQLLSGTEYIEHKSGTEKNHLKESFNTKARGSARSLKLI